MVECKDCTEHTGIVARITSLEKHTEKLQKSHDRIETKLNQILGAVLVATLSIIGKLIWPVIKEL